MFPNLIVDNLVQLSDMFRLDGSKSFVGSGETITEVNIYPDFANNPATKFNVYVEDCPEEWVLDWAYDTAGDYVARVELVTGSGSKAKDYNVKAIDEAEDNLQSSDSMLYAYESELKRYIPAGRNSWKYLHRKALEEILDYLFRNGKRNSDGTRIEKSQLIGDKLEKWSTFETLIMIFQDIKSSNIDLFNEKIADYSEARNQARKIYMFEYDENKDGQVDEEDYKQSVRQSFFTR